MAKSMVNHGWLYNTTRWRKLSRLKRMEQPLCEECLLYDVIKPADLVDHVKEVEDHPDLAFDYDNLRSLCLSCHNTKTADVARKRNEEDNGFPQLDDFF